MAARMSKKRVLSGIQPTGRFHWGNYFGAIQQYIDLQGEEQSFYFIANLHALTTVRVGDAKEFARFADAYAEKYGRRPRNENIGEIYLYRMGARRRS